MDEIKVSGPSYFSNYSPSFHNSITLMLFHCDIILYMSDMSEKKTGACLILFKMATGAQKKA